MRASALFLPKFLISSAKMKAEGIPPSAIGAFENTFNSLVSGNTGLILESTIDPVPDLINSKSFIENVNENENENQVDNTSLLSSTVVLKLNGGLGTSMGLDKAKSLLKVKDNDTFLDLTAKQIINMRNEFGSSNNVKFMLMNSFSTSKDTINFLQQSYPQLLASSESESSDGLFEEMIQNKVPKIDATTYEPAVCKNDPNNEWCPPGHGDLYAALEGSGCLDSLLDQGYKYMFVSNSDNLGATLDLSILTYFANSDTPFMMECCERTENDKKGGHIAIRKVDKQLILRESAMCSKEDEESFQDITKHKYFNTNNLWIRLDKLKEILNDNGGYIPLPMIKNEKTVDPKDDTSQKVLQLETAMGAAIECFHGATAIVVDRTRFAPVKKCNDLLLLRSDAYVIDENHKPILNPNCNGKAPTMELDSKKYKFVTSLENATKDGIPSLVKCTKLKITGLVTMTSKTQFVGDVHIINNSSIPKRVPSGIVTGNIDLTEVEVES